MKLNASLLLALRYLKPKWSFLSVITLLSIIGPVLGVAILIVVIAVFAGFGREIRKPIFLMQSHLTLRNFESDGIIEDPDEILTALHQKGVEAAATYDGPVLVQRSRQIETKMVRGIAPKADGTYPFLNGQIVSGELSLGDDEAVVGYDLAQILGIHVGDSLVIHSTGQLQNMVEFDADDQIQIVEPDEIYMPSEVTVTGIFRLGMYDYDSNFIMVNLEEANEIFDRPWDSAGAIQLWAEDPYNLQPLYDALREEPSVQNLYMLTWKQANRQLFEALQTEKNLQFFLLSFILVVAAFCIASMLITIVIQKTREIGVLKAMGATFWSIISVFLLQGAVVGVIGTCLGTGLGLLIVRCRDGIAQTLAYVTGFEIFPAELYQLSSIPAHLEWPDMFRIVVMTFVICVLASTVPACYAAAISPSKALKNETG